MLTAFYMTSTLNIRDEYLYADAYWETFGIEALDAPERISAGSTYSLRYGDLPDECTPMPSAVDRVH